MMKEERVEASSSFKIASSGDIGFRDYSLNSSKPSLSLTHLDDVTFSNQIQLPPPSSSSVPSLASLCVRVFGSHWNRSEVLDGLQADHILSSRRLLDEVEKVSGSIPLKVHLAFAALFGTQLPLKRRTFKRLVLDDVKELNLISQMNLETKEEYRIEVAKNKMNETYAKSRGRRFIPVEIHSPSFFLSTLDLSHDTTLLNDHIYKFKPICTFLAVLRLDYTQVGDDGISFLCRGMGEKEEYERLEVLTLKGLKKVSDLSAIKVSLLPALRMLDVRGTSCTSNFRQKLQGDSNQINLWRPARYRSNLNQHISLELELFGPSYSSSKILTLIRYLAATEHSHPVTELLDKPITLHITGVSRQIQTPTRRDSSIGKTAEELYHEQISLTTSNSNAVYNSVYGGVACTTRIARGVLDEDAQGEKNVGAAFRSRTEHIAAGASVSRGRGIASDGRNTLFSVGQRKLSSSSKIVEELLSDWGSDEEAFIEEDAVTLARQQYEEEKLRQAQLPSFYRQSIPSPPNRSVKRTPTSAETSELMLLRHLPLLHPCEKIPNSTVMGIPKPIAPVLTEGSSLKRKKPTESFSRPLDSFTSTSTSNSNRPPLSIPEVKASLSSNPFAKKRIRVDSIISVTSLNESSSKLPSRSGMAVFSKKR